MSTTTSHAENHIGPRTYLIIYAALLGLMALTVIAALFDMGSANFVVAMGIAAAKMFLIVVYFMHVRDGTNLTKAFSAAAFLWMIILIVGVLNDYFTRGIVGTK